MDPSKKHVCITDVSDEVRKEIVEARYREMRYRTQTVVADVASNSSDRNVDDLEDDMKYAFVEESISNDYKSSDAVYENGRTAFFYANLKQVKTLLERGADPLIKDIDGKMAHEFNIDVRDYLSTEIEALLSSPKAQKSRKSRSQFFKERQREEERRLYNPPKQSSFRHRDDEDLRRMTMLMMFLNK